MASSTSPGSCLEAATWDASIAVIPDFKSCQDQSTILESWGLVQEHPELSLPVALVIQEDEVFKRLRRMLRQKSLLPGVLHTG